MKNHPLPGSTSANSRPHWTRRIIFNATLLVMLGIIAYSLLRSYTTVSVPAIVTGTLVDVSPPSSGVLTRLHVEPNATVQKGQPLVQLHNETLSARIAAASADLEQLVRSRDVLRSDANQALSRFSINEKIADIRMQIATLDVEIASTLATIRAASGTCQLRQEAVQRAQELFNAKALTASDLDIRRLALTDARDALLELQTKKLQSETKRRGLLASIDLYQQQLKNLEQEIENSLAETDLRIQKLKGEIQTFNSQQQQLTLRAEVDGVVSEIVKDQGELVAAGETILTISTGDIKRVEAFLPPEERNTVVVDSPAEIVVDSAGRIRLPGTVKGVLPVLKTMPVMDNTPMTSQETFAVVLLEFSQPQQARQYVQPGQRVNVIFKKRR